MDNDVTPQTPPQDWLNALQRGDADLGAGRIAPWQAVRPTLADVLAAMERGADAAERERLLLNLDAIEDETYEGAPHSPRR